MQMGKMKNTVTLSKSEQVSQALWDLMASEKMESGDQIPTENILTKHLNVSRVTVRKVLCSMAEQGILIKKKGKGTFLSERFSLSEAMEKQSKNIQKVFTVGIVLSALKDDYFRMIATACERELSVLGIKTILWAANSASEVEKYMQNFNLLDGLIISPVDIDFTTVLLQKFPHLPMVFVNEIMAGKIDSIASDDFNGAYQAVKYLHSLGHRRIVHMHGPLNTSTGSWRHQGYLKAMQDCDLNEYIQEEKAGYKSGSNNISQNNDESGYAAMKRLLKKNQQPEAVFCANDTVAVGVYAAIQEAGLRIPEDISVIGYGNGRYSVELSPQLTTIDQHPDLIGTMASERILRRLHGNTSKARNIKIPASLIFRKSCGTLQRE